MYFGTPTRTHTGRDAYGNQRDSYQRKLVIDANSTQPDERQRNLRTDINALHRLLVRKPPTNPVTGHATHAARRRQGRINRDLKATPRRQFVEAVLLSLTMAAKDTSLGSPLLLVKSMKMILLVFSSRLLGERNFHSSSEKHLY